MKKLALLVAALAAANAFAEVTSFLSKPDIHGDMVVFTAEGDLWLSNLKDRVARRITSDSGLEQNARFSPNGKLIAFTGNYDGGNDVYVMPIEGGPPKRLTYDPTGALVLGWAPDGRSILFRSRRYSPVGGVRRLYTVPVEGGQVTAIPVPQGDFGSIAPDGTLAYVPVSNEWANWFRYQAGRADDIWTYNSATKAFKQLTTYKGIDTTPVWCDGHIYMVSERTGVSNLYRLATTGGDAVNQITHYADAPVRYPGSDGKRVIFQHGPALAVYDPATDKTTELTFDMASDQIHEREARFGLAAHASNPSLGPAGRRLTLESRGQIVSVAAENGDLRVLEKHDGARASMPAWSPDGTKVAFISDRTGENEIWLTNSAGGGEPTQLTHGLQANPYPMVWSGDNKHLGLSDRNGRILMVDATTGVITPVDRSIGVQSYNGGQSRIAFSPDGKFLAFDKVEANWLQQVYIYEVGSAKKTAVTNPNVNSQLPAFSADGKFLLFIADSQLTPSYDNLTHKYEFDNERRIYMVALAKATESPFLPKNEEEGAAAAAAAKAEASPVTAIDYDGLSDRLIEVPMPSGRYWSVVSVPGKLLVLNESVVNSLNGPGSGTGVLQSFDIEHPALTTIVSGIDSFDKSFDSKKLLIVGPAGAQVIDATSGPTGFSPLNLSAYTLTVNPVAEWHQIFEETWRVARDFFYDPGMNGNDWDAVHRKYSAQMKLVASRNDLARVQSDMVSELNSGHAYVVDPTPGPARIPIGFLGADFVTVPALGSTAPHTAALRIIKLYRGDGFAGNRSPLLQPGLNVKEGDYILSIAGQPVMENQDPEALLVGLVNQTVALQVNSTPALAGARTIRLRPLGSEDALRYVDWVAGRARYVREHGGEDMGYLHVPDMEGPGAIGFTKGQFPNVYKSGMIYDIRYNTGGFISSMLLENIALKPQAWWSPRAGAYWTREDWANVGHKVALCNEFNFSDGELFIEIWKRMKLGTVIGRATGGGEVGSGGGYGLVDGGSIYIPNYAGFVNGQWLIEGVGAAPDISVDQNPAAVMAGRDPQLDKAIEVLKAQIAKDPIQRPQRPPYPKKGPPPIK